MIHSTMNRRSVSLNKKSKPRIRYLVMKWPRHDLDYKVTLITIYTIFFSKSSHKDDVWINPFIRPPICSIIIAVSISFVGACLLYLDRDESIMLSKQVNCECKRKDLKWKFTWMDNFRLNYGLWLLLVVDHYFF